MAQEHDQPLTTWASTWNSLWPAPQGEQSAPLTDVQREHLTGLYALVAEDLRRLGSTAKHRWLGDSTQDRVFALFERLVTGLLGRRYPLPCDDERVRRLLLRIASNRSIDQFRSFTRRASREVELNDDIPTELTGLSPQEAAAAHIHDRQVIEAVWAYWADLPWPDGEIVRLRHRLDGDRLRTFASIAAHLGPQHKPNTVERTYRRILERTREHLRQLGYLGDEGENAHG